MYLAETENSLKIESRPLNGLGWDFSWWDYYTALLTGNEYTIFLENIWQRISWNQGISCIPVNLSSSCINQEEIDHIYKTYANAVAGHNGTPIPEYDRKRNASKIEYIEQEVARRSNRPVMRVKIVLWNIYWATFGTNPIVQTHAYILPLTYKKQLEESGTTPEQFKDQLSLEANGSFKNPLADFLNILKWVGLIGAGVFIVGGSIYLLNNVKRFSAV